MMNRIETTADKKRAIAYIGGPRQLQDFIWYYLAYGKEYTWDLVCQPMYKEMGLEKNCRESGLFEEIYMPDSFLARPRGELIKIGAIMSLYWLFGMKKKYARHEIAKFADLTRYKHMCLSTTIGVTCGMMALAADDSISIDLLEDGIGDNTDANAKLEIRRWRERHYLISYVFAKMGYCNPRGIFPLKSTKRCRRYSAKPEMLSKELYKEVNQLCDMSLIDMKEYQELVDKTFGKITDFSKAQSILFTTNMKDFTPDFRHCIDKVMTFFLTKGCDILAVKKHPRDLEHYDITGCITIMLNSMIPGEIIANWISNQKIYFMFPSTVISEFKDKNVEINIFRFSELNNILYYQHSFEATLGIAQHVTGITLKIIEL